VLAGMFRLHLARKALSSEEARNGGIGDTPASAGGANKEMLRL
jgi:hypothetical protein